MHICVHVCIPKYVSTTCPVHIVLLVCTFSRLTLWYGIGYLTGVLFPGEDSFSVSQQPLITYSDLRGTEAL